MGGSNLRSEGVVAVQPTRLPRAALLLLALSLATASFAAFFVLILPLSVATAQSGDLTVDIIAGYNLVVDSNASSPSTFAPSVATVMGRFCNIGSSPINDVQAHIGDFASKTPGVYPARSGADLNGTPFQGTGTYSFTHMGGSVGTQDATRFIEEIGPGECKVQYWHFKYPQCSNLADGTPDEPPCDRMPTWGSSVKPDDDLWLEFDVWAEAPGGHSDNERRRMTMRNEISAMANKIEPNPDGVWFNTTSPVTVGQVITSNGVRYELGNVRHGFDNDGDYAPDFNAWMQPVGDPSYDPSCFRLIRTHGVLTITRGAGKPDLILYFKDWEDPHPVYGGPLYFTNLPPDNTGVIGVVHYVFEARKANCTTTWSPYQEVASGFDNEKFNGDYGGALPPTVVSLPPEVTVDKTGNVTATQGGWITYTVDAENTGTEDVGLGLYGSSLAISDTVPASTTYGSYEASASLTARYSVDGGQTWTTTQPAGGITNVQWWFDDPLAAGTKGTVTFTVQVDGSAAGAIENCAEVNLSGGPAIARDCTTTLVEGTYSIGDFVWRDLDNDKTQDGGSETGIDGVTVWLYWDKDGDGALDTSVDPLVDTTTTGGALGTGMYTFTKLSAGNYLVKVDTGDAQIPEGYRLTTDEVHAVALKGSTSPYDDADFGFGPSLRVSKEFVGGSGYEGREVSYNITVRNLRPGGGETVAGGCRYETWASTGSTADPPKNFTDAFNTYGEPDGNYAYGDFSIGSNRWIQGTGFDPSGSGSITKVEAIIPFYLSKSLNDDEVTTRLYNGATELGTAHTFTTTLLNNNYVGLANAQYLVWDVSDSSYAPGGSWGWDDFALLALHLEPTKVSGADDSVMNLDAIGFRITSDEACPVLDSDDVFTLVPLTDTYDTSLLQFVSAVPSPTLVSGGVISWTDIGPIYPGQSKVVQVTFLGLEPSPQVPTIANNTACSTDSEFSDGTNTNDDCDTTSGYITPTGYISGIVWSDLAPTLWQVPNGYDSGDLRIPGVSVNLYYCEGLGVPQLGNNDTCTNQTGTGAANGTWQLVDMQVTDAYGHYLFDGLIDGWYYISVTRTSVPGNLTATDDADDSNAPYDCVDGECTDIDSLWNHPGADLQYMWHIDVAGETMGVEAITNTNFGYTVQPSLYGTVWEDVDGDGTRESGEEGIAGVVITLTSSSGVSTTVTDANGYYTFTNLSPGIPYTITVNTNTLPSGGSWTQTDDPDATLDDEHTVTLSPGEISGSHDFGYHRHSGPYSIGDTVYADWNGDGNQDSGEEGIAGITVTLYTNAGAYVTETVTSSIGYYTFTGLVTGTYVVVVDTDGLPSSWDDYDGTQDPDETGTCSTCDNRGSSGVSSTLTSDPEVDFGYQPKGYGSIGDYVWYDENGDGVQDSDETGLADITVLLYEDDGNGTYEPGTDALIMTTTTGSDGEYLFEYLSAGNYLVIVDTGDDDLPTDGFGERYYLTTDNPHPVTLVTSQDYEDADFGFTAPGAIGDTIWQDNYNFGIQDDEEPGISGVTVWLNSGGSHAYTATTDANGTYSFTGIVSGSYEVEVDITTLPTGYTQTGDPDLTTVCSGGDCDSQSSFDLRAGQIDMTRDFGYKPSRILGDYVWFDLNGNGVQDESGGGLGNVTVRLIQPDNDVFTTTTDSDGYYSFGGTQLGEDCLYTVQVDTSTLPFAQISRTYDLDMVLDDTATLTITSSPYITDVVDFGYRYDGAYTISGTIFYGASGPTEADDLYESGTDTPYPDITVYLVTSDGQRFETTTNGNGVFSFTNLINGVYTVSVSANSPQLSGLDLTASVNPGYTYSGVTINDGDEGGQDFGFYQAMDFGDLPAVYNATTLADEGAHHVSGTLILGTNRSTEGDTRGESSTASADTQDDGVLRDMSDQWTPGASVDLIVTVSGGTGRLVGWFDWDNDGAFDDNGSFQDFGSVSGSQSLALTVPPDYTTGTTVTVRFRLFDPSQLPGGALDAGDYIGSAINGEVEDYQWAFTSPNAAKGYGIAANSGQDAWILPVSLLAVILLGPAALLWRRVRKRRT
jgi:hypothetical protein